MEYAMNQKRRVVLAIAVVAAVAGSYVLGRHHSASPSGGATVRRVLYYVDPMHPSYKSDKPGIAPDCGMKLEPVYADQAANVAAIKTVALPSGAVGINGDMQKLLGIRVAEVGRSGANRLVRVVGRVAPDDTRIYRLNSGVEGFIRETYQDAVGTQVKKDQKLGSYYSPDFLAVASGFLAASIGVPGAANGDGARTVPFPGAVSKQGVSSLQGYMDRLQNLGMSQAQIRHIAETRQLPESIDIVSPTDGFILSRNITAGQHFDHDMEFYRIADLAEVWVLAEVDEQEATYLRPGALATVGLRSGGRELSGKVTESLPQSEIGGGTIKLRLEVGNPGLLLRPDMLVDVKFPVHLPPGITVPADALVDSGARTRVYVERSEGIFEPREVETGWRSGGQVEIKRGIQPGERVVVAATFLVDSESQLKSPAPLPAAAPKILAKTVIDPSCGAPVDPAKAAESGYMVKERGVTYYFCSLKCKDKFHSHTSEAAVKQASGK
jgi:Cu(I)/Ag(I) efflux system membrane fusion protein